MYYFIIGFVILDVWQSTECPENVPDIFQVRLPWMVEMPRFFWKKSGDCHGWWKCQDFSGKNLVTAMDGGNAKIFLEKIW
jgi:hypothetical protein